MLTAKIRVEAHAVETTARWGVVIVLVCGCLGVVVALDRAIRVDRLAEGVAVLLVSTMATVVSSVVLLFIAWRAGAADPPGRSVAPATAPPEASATRRTPVM